MIGELEGKLGGVIREFFGSETMDGIVAKGLSSVLRSLTVKEVIADQINGYVKSQLKDTKNSEALYLMIKEKFLYWFFESTRFSCFFRFYIFNFLREENN